MCTIVPPLSITVVDQQLLKFFARDKTGDCTCDNDTDTAPLPWQENLASQIGVIGAPHIRIVDRGIMKVALEVSGMTETISQGGDGGSPHLELFHGYAFLLAKSLLLDSL